MPNAQSVLDRRRAGILLHITSLPGPYSNGDLGSEAFRFVDFLAESGVSVWQTLPINPTHEDGSPYQCLSAHAGNPYLISLEWLVDQGWLALAALGDGNSRDSSTSFRQRCLKLAFESFYDAKDPELLRELEGFCEMHRSWLDDYALFMAIRESQSGRSWHHWPERLRKRESTALAKAGSDLAGLLARIKFEQFIFFKQWHSLRAYANSRGVLLFGDIPIFVAEESADVWAHQEDFDLEADGSLRVVAGVPPDYFSTTGQRWGNPHYDWSHMEASNFSWWVERLKSQLDLYDWVRIDHFRGLEAYWEIPSNSATAMEGRWVKAPGEALLSRLYEVTESSVLPLIAEDLGIITPEVVALRDRFNIPGMLILQFAFDGGDGNPYLPRNHGPNSVVYTGTHDNDTTASWFDSLSEGQRAHVFQTIGAEGKKMPLALMECAMRSVARLAVLPMQDVLHLGAGFRMNTPGTVTGNWSWRFSWEQLTEQHINELTSIVHESDRAA